MSEARAEDVALAGEACVRCGIPDAFHLGYDHGKGLCLVDGTVAALALRHGLEKARRLSAWAIAAAGRATP
jgi:hypothetical protein